MKLLISSVIAFLALCCSTAAALTFASALTVCTWCYTGTGDECTTGYSFTQGAWIQSCKTAGLWFYRSNMTGATSSGGADGALPPPLFAFQNGQMFRLPGTPGNVVVPQPPPAPAVNMQPKQVALPKAALDVRPISSTGSGASRARCAQLSADAQITASELSAWNALSCTQYY